MMRQSLAPFCRFGQSNWGDRSAVISLTTDRNTPQSTPLAHEAWTQGHSLITACKDPQTLPLGHHGGQAPNLAQCHFGSVYVEQRKVFCQFPTKPNHFLASADKPGNSSERERCGPRFKTVRHRYVHLPQKT